MITVIHVDHGLGRKITCIAVNDAGNRVLGQRYFCGYDKPNYPMPAIPIEVEYCSWAIAVCEMNDPTYTYGIITLYPHD